MPREVQERLDILGGVKIPAGAAAGKVLTSDASGNVSWASAALAGTNEPDNPASWTADLGYDQEFDRSGALTTLPTNWSWLDQGASTYTEDKGAAVINVPARSTLDMSGIMRSIPAAGAWSKITARISGFFDGTTNYAMLGLFVRNSATGKLHSVSVVSSGIVESMPWNNTTTENSGGGSATIPSPLAANNGWVPPIYVRFNRSSSTSYYIEASVDGVTWKQVNNLNVPGNLGAEPDQAGIYATMTNSRLVQVAVHWFRVR